MLQPFSGWVYREQPRVAPVIDALTPSQAHKLRQDPYQALHVSLPETPAHLPSIWNSWIQSHVLIREPLPALYAYSQTFYRYGGLSTPHHRLGVVGLLSTQTPLLPHEATLSERIDGLKRTLQFLPVQATPIHILARGAWETILPLLQSYLSCPRFSVGSEEGVMHRWSPIHHRAHQIRIAEALREGPFFIADGHHRYQAVREKGFSYYLVYVSPDEDPSLYIAPTHRLFRSLAPVRELLEEYFEIRPSAARVPLWQEVQGLRYAIGIVPPRGHPLLARLKSIYWSNLQERPLVDWLHTWILDPLASPRELTFSREPSRLVEAALRGEGWAFLLPELNIEYVKKAALQGSPLPPKATYFFPKVLSGLCFYYEDPIGVSLPSA